MICILGDHDLPRLSAAITSEIGAVVIGNALHWMDEPATLRAAAALLRPGGAVAVVTQGPPLWLGPAPWQVAVREVLEHFLGPVVSNCRSDQSALEERVDLARAVGLDVEVVSWHAEHRVDADWVLGHLGSAMTQNQLPARLTTLLGALETKERGASGIDTSEMDTGEMVVRVTTTAVVARRRN